MTRYKDMIEGRHFGEMLALRDILSEWVIRAIDQPDKTEDRDDGTRHYLKQIPEYGDRWLRRRS